MATEKPKYPHPFPIVPRKALWFTISLLVFLAGGVKMVYNTAQTGRPLDFGIDFTGGSAFVYQFSPELPGSSTLDAIRQVRGHVEEKAGIPNANIQAFPTANQLQIRTQTGSEQDDVAGASSASTAEAQKILQVLTAAYPDSQVELVQRELVGPVIGKQLRRQAFWSVIIGCSLIMVYVYFRYNIGGLGGGLLFGIAAVLALVHDVLIMIVAYAFTGNDIDTTFIASILTVIGFSMQDTVIIFDRIRENLRKLDPLQRRDFKQLEAVVEFSLWQTMGRSIATVASTVLPLIALILLGGVTIRNFALALFIGMVAGSWSSIFLAAPMLLVMYNRWQKRRGDDQVVVARPVRDRPGRSTTAAPVRPGRPSPARPAASSTATTALRTDTSAPAESADGSDTAAAGTRTKKKSGGKGKRRY